MLWVNISEEEIKRHGRYGCFKIPYKFVDEEDIDSGYGNLKVTIQQGTPLQISPLYGIPPSIKQRILNDFFYKYNSIKWG